MSCPLPLAPQTIACGDGTCIDSFHCLCPPGWSGKGDFVFGEPSCNIHLESIRYMWLFVFLANFVTLLFSAQCVWRAGVRNSANQKRFFQSYGFGFAMNFLIESLFMGSCAILKLVDPGSQIGQNVVITVLFAIGFMGFALGCILFLVVFLELNTKNARIRNGKLKDDWDKLFLRLRVVIPSLGTLTVLFGTMPLFMLLSQSSQDLFALALIHYLGMAGIIAVFCLGLIPWLLNPLARDIASMINTDISGDPKEKDKLRVVHGRIVQIVTATRQNTFPNLLPALLFGCWPFLQGCSSYWLPFTWTCGSVVSFVLLQISQPSDRKRCCGRVLARNHVSTTKGSTGQLIIPRPNTAEESQVSPQALV